MPVAAGRYLRWAPLSCLLKPSHPSGRAGLRAWQPEGAGTIASLIHAVPLAAVRPIAVVRRFGLPSSRAHRDVAVRRRCHGDAQAPKANPSVVGLVLSGAGATLVPPTGPPPSRTAPQCHPLIDPGFTGKCVVATGAVGTVAGIVEEETASGPYGQPAGAPGRSRASETLRGPGTRPRLASQGARWVLALGASSGNTGLPSLLWADDVARNDDVELVFVTPTDRAGFGNELDLVAGTGGSPSTATSVRASPRCRAPEG